MKALKRFIFNPQNQDHVFGKKRAVIYARVSGKSKEDDEKLKSQIDRCEQFIKNVGWKHLATFVDRCSVHFELGQSLLHLICADSGNKFDYVVFTDISRLSRNLPNLITELNCTFGSLLVPIKRYKLIKYKYVVKKY